MRYDRSWPLAADASGISYGGFRFRAASCRNAHGPDCHQGALANPSDVELNALITATNAVPAVTYGLPVWIEGASDGELNRRVGHEYELLPPEAAINPYEDAVSIDAAIAMRATFAQESPAVLALFDALARLLTGCGRKQ